MKVHPLATMQAMGRPVSADDFCTAVQSGTYFVGIVMRADAVANCAVPPGAFSVIDTTLKGLTHLGCLLRVFGPAWWVCAGQFNQVAVADHQMDGIWTLMTLLWLMLSTCCAGHRCAWIIQS